MACCVAAVHSYLFSLTLGYKIARCSLASAVNFYVRCKKDISRAPATRRATKRSPIFIYERKWTSGIHFRMIIMANGVTRWCVHNKTATATATATATESRKTAATMNLTQVDRNMHSRQRPLILDIHVLVNWYIHWPYPRDRITWPYRDSSFKLSEVTPDQVAVDCWPTAGFGLNRFSRAGLFKARLS